MIIPLSLHDHEMVEQVWGLQHTAYRLEALAVGLTEYPPLPDTFESLRNSTERFYGYISDEEGDLMGAIATTSFIPGNLEITRLMVHSSYLRQGIGSSLLKYVISCHPEVETFGVTAGTLNIAAVSLYQEYGFMPYGTIMAAPGVELTRFQLKTN
ncbi:ribosomal protein S18 acetylase RimI-like enzyme [Paenibacillus anaericanus]|uniref:GNAT family N-acetyltransferase n=1 Tax=Paenibacillus anaericanus TaxID=170367 RepID=A0A433Y578_9BACL|nr:GNAT family N-acetyltransferase [Paenibacillus anaericanus]MDQ0091238.1 ribosomal protein S18 acetylase RimI-like enzyme [Paenibacillus anaericanus]RUT43881.1 GNAT family N-acetyltransferase [Paenibacillus anaericanus]